MQEEKVEIPANNISKKTRFLGYFNDTNMNLLFQRKCVNALSRVFMVGLTTFSKHLVNIWSTRPFVLIIHQNLQNLVLFKIQSKTPRYTSFSRHKNDAFLTICLHHFSIWWMRYVKKFERVCWLNVDQVLNKCWLTQL